MPKVRVRLSGSPFLWRLPRPLANPVTPSHWTPVRTAVRRRDFRTSGASTHPLGFILSAVGLFYFCPDMFDLSRDLTLSSCRSRSFHRFAPTRVRYIESFLCALPTVHAAIRAPMRFKRASSSPYTATEIPYLHHHHCMVPIRDAL
jgi:hypothetical protein